MQINWKCGKHKYLFFILMLGCILRIVPISWGVPISPYIQNYHPDEPKVYSTILNFPEVYLNFNQSPVYGTCVQYVIGLLLFLPKLVISKLLHDGGLYFIMMLLASRLFSIMMGTATIYLTYQLAGKVFDAKTALLSAAFIAVSFYHVLNSSVITLDIAMSMLMVINFLLCFKAFEDNSQASYIKLGIATGFLLGTKITGGLFFAVPFLLSMMNIIKMKSDSGARRNLFLKQANLLLVYVFTAGAVFAMFHPHVFMDFSKYLNFYSIQKVNWMDRSRDSVFHTVLKCFTQTATSGGISIVNPMMVLSRQGKQTLIATSQKLWTAIPSDSQLQTYLRKTCQSRAFKRQSQRLYCMRQDTGIYLQSFDVSSGNIFAALS